MQFRSAGSNLSLALPLDVMPVPQPAALVLAFVFGALIGSFLNVCIARWPEGLSVVRPPSRCPNCGRGVRWYENVPILGWIGLRGRCAGCHLPISIVYPIVELLVALGWLASVAAFGPSIEALRVAVFGTVLLGIAATDARHYLIPDGFTLFLLGWQLVAAFAVWFLPDAESSPFAGPYGAIVGACTGAGAIAILRWLGERAFGREAMGEGDVTMMAGVGAALGAERAGLTVLVAAFIGALVAAIVVVPARVLLNRRQAAAMETDAGTTLVDGADDTGGPRDLTEIPFGVFLAPAAMLTLLWGDRMIGWYVTHILHP